MQHYLNNRLVQRNRRLSRVMTFGGIGATLVAVLITFFQPGQIAFAFVLMIGGAVISQFGTVIYNRFGRSPRMDEVLDDSLKGLDDRHAIFHYYLGASHALFTPSGTYAIVHMLERGEVRHLEGSWKHTPPRGRLHLRQPRERTLKRFEKDALAEASQLKRYLDKNLPGYPDVEVEPLVLFLAKDIQVHVESSPFLVTHRKKLKSELRKVSGSKAFSAEDLQSLAGYLKNN